MGKVRKGWEGSGGRVGGGGLGASALGFMR